MNRAFGLLVLVGLWLGMPAGAMADVPQKKTVVLNIREVPGDLQSELAFQVEIDLQLEEQSGDQLGWSIYEISFTQYIDGVERSWNAVDAIFDTTDGLWWTTHADVENPELSEFTDMPYVEGVAGSKDPAVADLEFYLAGQMPGGPSLSQPTTLLTHYMQLAGESVPEEEGEEEPADMDDNPTGAT